MTDRAYQHQQTAGVAWRGFIKKPALIKIIIYFTTAKNMLVCRCSLQLWPMAYGLCAHA